MTGGERFGARGLGDKGATGGSTCGVRCSKPFAVVGRGGEFFVGDSPVTAGGKMGDGWG